MTEQPTRRPFPTTTVLFLTGLVAVVIAVAALTDWRWGLLLVGLLLVAGAVLTRRGELTETPTEGDER